MTTWMIVGIIVGSLVLSFAALNFILTVVANRAAKEEEARLAKMSPEERRAYEYAGYRAKHEMMATLV